MRRVGSRIGAFICFNLMVTAAWARESTIYTYDALGRLISTSIAGGPNDGLHTSTDFDTADNRTNYTVTGAPTANFSIADASVTEGGVATVTITRAGSLAGVVTVDYGTSNGSAVAPSDYTAVSGTLTFTIGETSKTISIVTADDAIYEGAEDLGITLSRPSGGASLADPNAVVTIADNEVVPQLTISNATVTEGEAAVLTVTRSGALGSSVTVNYASTAGSAVAPGDYGAVSGTLNFLPGETLKTITVATVDDNVHEGPEGFTVGLSGATGGAIISTGGGAVSLADNDSPPSFAISNAGVTEGGSAVMTVTKSGATALNLSVTYATANGSAIAPGDYTAAAGTLTFLPGETSKSISIATIDDAIYELAETFSVNLSGASGGASISTATGTATITENDVMPSLSVSNVSVMEGASANVTVVKSGATGVNASVAYATSPGTAGTGAYTSTSGTLTFLPGETSKTIRIPTTNNVIFSASKMFNLTLSAPSNAAIAAPTAVVTILEDDPAPSFIVVAPTQKDEGSVLQFGIALSGNLYYDVPLTVNYSTSSGTATSGTDFTPVSGTLTLSPPSTNGYVLVPTTQDNAVEPDETILLTISSPNYGTIITAQAAGVIKNDDIPPSTGPVANTDNAGAYSRCSFFAVNPIANDTDPAGHYPLTLVSVATGAGYTRTISGNTVYFDTFGTGTKTVQYVVANSVGGQATGTITFTLSSGPVCL